jgi:hypothetical protein
LKLIVESSNGIDLEAALGLVTAKQAAGKNASFEICGFKEENRGCWTIEKKRTGRPLFLSTQRAAGDFPKRNS